MELEKTLGQALEKENAMAREIGGLMEEKKEKERTIMRLMEENDAGKKFKIMANAEIEDKKELVQKLLREKNEIEEVKAIKEGEIVKLHKEACCFSSRSKSCLIKPYLRAELCHFGTLTFALDNV
ncbi:hypothetical protein OIU77_003962 [Salix suchowensis]|uniref:Uncharacterized protein n=1 Tax=Salix suchowensis TaxID=1278906 RepID=A0ABQ9AUB5_9ROSI|nr:hypothetical protein OIU77_003962 [Salix suchowensis]